MNEIRGWFSIGLASTAAMLPVPNLWIEPKPGKSMTNKPIDDEMPAEIDFSKASRGRHSIPADAAVFQPASIERKGVGLSQLLTEVLKRDIEMNEPLK